MNSPALRGFMRKVRWNDGLDMKAKHCDTCQHKTVEEAILTGGQWKTRALTCAIGHKPRFFKPRFIHDYNWGWKRSCADYEQKGN